MKVFVTGVAGQLGHDVINELDKRGVECVASDLASQYSGVADGTAVTKCKYVSLDITDAKAVEEVLVQESPDAVVHCAAWTAVDLAEDEDKREKVHLVNVVGTQNIADAVKKVDASLPNGCKMMYISTDYVFDGQGETPWDPDCKDYAPLNVYGESKLAGELAVSETVEKFFVVRTAWVFGQNGENFIKTMLKVGKKSPKIKVVSDQIGTPTYTIDLAVLLCDIVESQKYGYYHATNSELLGDGYTEEGCKCGYISWYDFTKEIFRLAVETGHSEYSEDCITVTPVTTAEYGISKAVRPFNSRLDKTKLEKNGFHLLPSWQDATRRYLSELDFESIV